MPKVDIFDIFRKINTLILHLLFYVGAAHYTQIKIHGDEIILIYPYFNDCINIIHK